MFSTISGLFTSNTRDKTPGNSHENNLNNNIDTKPDTLHENSTPETILDFFSELLGISDENTNSSRDSNQQSSDSDSDSGNSTDSEHEPSLPKLSSPDMIFNKEFLPDLQLITPKPKDYNSFSRNPPISHSPPILSLDFAIKLRNHLPPLLKEATSWNLIYSTDIHGISLSTLYRNSNDNGPVIIIVKDELGNVFGGFSSEELHVDSRYYGNEECFLFKLINNDFKTWKPTGVNDYLVYTETHCLAFGGGGGLFGLWIDQELDHGHSETCLTFGNDSLSTESEFRIQTMELWNFII